MPRRSREHADPTPAAAMRLALSGLHRELRAAPAEKAGDLARKLAALARDLAELEKPTEKEAADAFNASQRRYDEEVERLLTLRTHERVNVILASRGLPPDDPLPPEAYVSFYDD